MDEKRWNIIKWTKIERSGMEYNEMKLSFHCLDIFIME